MSSNSLPQPARPILAYSRETGDALELVPSISEPGKFHVVDPINHTCDCKGFEFRRTCRHLSPMAPARPLADAELLPCSSCHNYHRTDAERLKAHPDARRLDGGAAYLRALS